jgi:hypothetical protein
MVAFYTFRQRFGEARFVDLNSLASDRFANCSELLSHSTLGARISFRSWFAHIDECGVPMPEIVFDTYDPSKDSALREHYEVVYEQRGLITTGRSQLAGSRVRADQFIAVRRDLTQYVTLSD